MGAFAGGLTYQVFDVRGDLPQGWRETFDDAIRSRVLNEIDVHGESEREVGWCNAQFALDIDLFADKYLFNDYLVLGLRVDTLTVPGPLLKLFVERRMREVMEEQGRERLSRYEKAELKELVKRELRKRALPTVKVTDMVWTLSEGVVRFFGTNEKLTLEFMELFEDTFGLALVPRTPYTLAAHHAGLEEAAVESLADLEPAALAGEYV
jgi:DNA recombination-dependent growth factor C